MKDEVSSFELQVSSFATTNNSKLVTCNSKLFYLQASNRLSMGEFHKVSVGIADHGKVADNTAGICRWLHQDPEFPSLLRYLIYVFSQFTLKAKMVNARCDFALAQHQKKNRFRARRSFWTEPNCSTTFKSTITQHPKIAE